MGRRNDFPDLPGEQKLMRSIICLILFHMLPFTLHLWGVQGGGPVPDLPRLTLDNFSPAIRGQIEQAHSYASSHPQDAAASGQLGMILQAYGLSREAAVCYQRAAQLEPSVFRWTYYLGIVEADQGACEQAIPSLRRALRSDPKYTPAKLRLANCLLASADWDASRELYLEIRKQDPGNPDAYYGLGRIRANRGDYAAATEAYGKAIALFPEFGAAHYALAMTYRALGDSNKAQEQLKLYEKNKTSIPPTGDQLLAEVRALNRSATYQIEMGMELERRGRPEESAAAHERALEIDPQLAQAHINLIKLYGQLGLFDKAEEHYRAAVRLDPGSAESYYNYGVLLVSAEKYPPAENAFRKTLEINPYYAAAHNNLGYVLERSGNLVEAAAEYRKAIENKPGDRQAHFNLGRILVNRQQYQAGIQELRKTIDPEDENTPRYLYALGAAYARSGDRQNALRYLRRARDGAAARGQSGLLASLDRDLHVLETPKPPQ